jgi:tetratricopeptide (TPR) repeat protein
MIVKNGAATLGRALKSVQPIADRILIGDTGSDDDSREIARALGAEVVDIPWEDDFSRARNRVLAMAQCDWIFVIDADEMLDASGPEKIRPLLAAADVAAYDIVRWNYLCKTTTRCGDAPPTPNPGVLAEAAAFPAYVISFNTRLFRRRPEVYFEYAVHETIVHRLDALGLKHPPANFILHHLGQAEDAEAVRKAKFDLYHRLGIQKVAQQPERAEGWFELGLSELEHHRSAAAALPHFEHARALEPGSARNSLFCGICLTALGRFNEAHARIAEAYQLGSRSPVLFEALGDVYFHTQHYDQARAAYLGGGTSPLNAAKLGACETVLGQPAQGLQRIRAAIEQAPAFAELYDILTAAAMLAGDTKLANESAEERRKFDAPQPASQATEAQPASQLA